MTEPRKTPRVDEAIECGGRGIVASASTLMETSRALEIETQELAEALEELRDEQMGAPLLRRQEQWLAATERANAALARHRANQPAQ